MGINCKVSLGQNRFPIAAKLGFFPLKDGRSFRAWLKVIKMKGNRNFTPNKAPATPYEAFQIHTIQLVQIQEAVFYKTAWTRNRG